MSNFKKVLWTSTMWERAQELYALGKSTNEIGEVIGMTSTQVRDRFYNQSYFRTGRGKGERIIAMPSASPAAIEDRDARYTAAARRTPTQEFCGDPPPGYSALDMKRKGIAP